MNTVMRVLGEYDKTAAVGSSKTRTVMVNKVIAQTERDFKKLVRQLED